MLEWEQGEELAELHPSTDWMAVRGSWCAGGHGRGDAGLVDLSALLTNVCSLLCLSAQVGVCDNGHGPRLSASSAVNECVLRCTEHGRADPDFVHPELVGTMLGFCSRRRVGDVGLCVCVNELTGRR